MMLQAQIQQYGTDRVQNVTFRARTGVQAMRQLLDWLGDQYDYRGQAGAGYASSYPVSRWVPWTMLFWVTFPTLPGKVLAGGYKFEVQFELGRCVESWRIR